jgi:hypothetical protein
MSTSTKRSIFLYGASTIFHILLGEMQQLRATVAYTGMWEDIKKDEGCHGLSIHPLSHLSTGH